eukprot:TRINITY_DN17539_c0_g1_i1.p1 TRINITY_DN17539_c0_g1~~TRINITY_DN17539_c0_g1_i1.p1  ORF type:complete len:277 (+),score=39.62 TRINITY_DN17539_c0_g1_i1:110-940(+)
MASCSSRGRIAAGSLHEEEVSNGAVLALADILADFAEVSERDCPDNKELMMFYSVEAPQVDLSHYLSRLCRYFRCSGHSYVAAAVYVRRVMNSRPDFAINSLSVHRFLLASVVVAAKATDDDFQSNKWYAEIGGVGLRDLNRLEVGFLKLLGWRTHVSREAYIEHREILEAAGAADRRFTSFAEWFAPSNAARSRQVLALKSQRAQPMTREQWVQAVVAACRGEVEVPRTPSSSDLSEEQDGSSSTSTAASTPLFGHRKQIEAAASEGSVTKCHSR